MWRSGIIDLPGRHGVSPNVRNIVPDVINYAWREYGMRVGLWRIAEVLDARGRQGHRRVEFGGVRDLPKAMEEMKKRGWEFMGHGTTNSENLAGLTPEKEKEVIQTVLKTIEQATGEGRADGWAPGWLRLTTRSIFSRKRA